MRWRTYGHYKWEKEKKMLFISVSDSTVLLNEKYEKREKKNEIQKVQKIRNCQCNDDKSAFTISTKNTIGKMEGIEIIASNLDFFDEA